MDSERFDRFAKTLSSPGTRRGALAALLGGSLSLLGLSQPAAGRKRRGGGGVTIEGPCGDGSGPANICDRHRDCCTRICARTGPNKPKRCRCRSQGEACTRTRNCCQGSQALVCDGGTCQLPCDPACGACEHCVQGACEADATKAGTDCGTSGTCLRNGTCQTECVPITTLYPSLGACSNDNQCCDKGFCCEFGAGTGCFDLLNNYYACGTSCGNANNCQNVPGTTTCVEGECV